MKKTRKLPTLAGLLAAALAAAPLLRADYTDHLLVGWTFNDGTLTSDLGSMSPVTFEAKSWGSNNHHTFNEDDGTVSLGAGRALVTTAINSTAHPELKDGFTLWARVKFDTLGGGAPVFGLIDGNTAVDGNAGLTATFRRINTSDTYFFGQIEDSEGTHSNIAPGGGFHTVTTGQYYTIAIRVEDTGLNGSTYASWFDGTTNSRLWNGSTHDLIDFQALALGRLLQGGGAGVTFDEVRLYNAVLTDEQLAAITAIPEPTTAALLAAGLVALFAIGSRRRRNR